MNINIDFVPWEILIQKPTNDIVAEFLRIAVSSSREKIHDDQCRNQIKDEIKISLSLPLISLLMEITLMEVDLIHKHCLILLLLHPYQ